MVMLAEMASDRQRYGELSAYLESGLATPACSGISCWHPINNQAQAHKHKHPSAYAQTLTLVQIALEQQRSLVQSVAAVTVATTVASTTAISVATSAAVSASVSVITTQVRA